MSLTFHNLYDGFSLADFRRLFYFVTPNETYTEYHQLYHFQSLFDNVHFWFIFLILSEWLYYMYKGLDTKRYMWADTITSVGAGMIENTMRVLTRSTEFHVYWWVFSNYRIADLPAQSWFTWILAFICIDFAYYWFHRTAHQVTLFWSFHQLHHSSNFYNLTNPVRLAPVEHVIIAPVYYLPLALILPPAVPLSHAYLNLLYQFWIHTEVVDKIGPLEYILNTPSHHRVHHGRNPYCIDKNFGAVLIIWDRMFGTFAQERKDEYPTFGLVTPLKTFDQLYIQLFYFWESIWVKPKSLTGWKNKIKSVLLPPDWHPDGNYEIPPVEDPVMVHIPDIPHWLNLYTLGHLVVFNMEVYMYMFYYEKDLEVNDKLWYAGYLIASTACYGYLLDMRWFGRYLELFRLSFTYFWNPLALILANQHPYFLYFYHAAFIGSMLIWALLSDATLRLKTDLKQFYSTPDLSVKFHINSEYVVKTFEKNSSKIKSDICKNQ